jgi:hypothetical protein
VLALLVGEAPSNWRRRALRRITKKDGVEALAVNDLKSRGIADGFIR